jgi:flagellar hook-associated protein FlgK
MSMDPVTAADPEKIAAAQDTFDIDGSNNSILFDDDAALGAFASQVIIPPGRYTGDELAAEIERQLEQNGTGQSYAVTYDTATHKFTIANNADPLTNPNDLFILWENDITTADFILGFNNKIYEITDGGNNQIIFSENGGPALTATLTAGPYTGEEMAAEIQKQLRAAGTEAYTVSYDSPTRRFTISNPADATGNLVMQWTASPNIADTLGFNHAVPGDNTTIVPTGSDTSDFSYGAIAVGTTVTSDVATDGANPGDNRNALALGGLKDISVLDKDTLTIGSFYSIFVGQVGSDVAGVTDAVSHENFMIDQFDQRRQSLAGVSVDEEMVNLIKYQQAYAASAKLITTLDTMLDQLLSIRS